ncbi:MAG: DUF5906 domain-containing protein [Nitrosopumilaceae archaeon]
MEILKPLANLSVVPCYRGTKIPSIRGWGTSNLKFNDISKNSNIAIKLGGPYCLVDIDIEEVGLANYLRPYIPATYSFGRESYRAPSHYIFKSNSDNRGFKLKGIGKDLLLEVRNNGLTIIPPSVYIEENKVDNIIVYNDKDIEAIDYDSLIRVIRLGFISYTIHENWPSQGLRQDATLGFAALLLNSSIEGPDVLYVIEHAIQKIDEELPARIKAIKATISKFKEGYRIAGLSLLKRVYDEDFLRYFVLLLGDNIEFIESVDVFNARYCWIENITAMWDCLFQRAVKLSDLKIQWGHSNKITNNNQSFKTVNVVDLWKESRGKNMYQKVIYEPGKPTIYENCVNIWPGWGCEPLDYIEEDIEPIINLLIYLFDVANTPRNIKYMRWFIQWLAYPLQYPGEKNHTVVLLYSQKEGVGKSLLTYVLEKIYGLNFVKVTEDIFNNLFGDHLMAKQFLVGSELTGSDRFKGMDRLKDLITEPTITINRKYQPVISVKNCLNVLLTSNNFDAIWVHSDDRRFFLWEVVAAPKHTTFYQKLGTWIEGKGPAQFFQYLLKVNLDIYNPHARAIDTPYKEIIKEVSKTKVDFLVQSILAKPDCPDLVSCTWMIGKCLEEGGTSVTLMSVAKSLQKISRMKRDVVLSNKRVIKAWAIKRQSKWRLRSIREWSDYANEKGLT